MDRTEALTLSAGEDVQTQSSSWLRSVLSRLFRNPSAVTGMVLLAIMTALTILAPLIARYGPDLPDFTALNQVPSTSHWFGTDYLGRDMWARTLYGGRISLPTGLGVVVLGLGIGGSLGLIAGYAGTLIDEVIMRLVDVLLAFPGVVLAIGIVSILGPSQASAIVAVGIASIPGYARLAHGSVLSAREREYVHASRALGGGPIHILVRHILINVVDPLVVLATLNLGGAILVTAALSFLGIGTQLPTSDWGTMLSEGYNHMFEAWSEVTFPGLAIVITVLGINLLGDGLADALNAKLKVD